MLNLGNLRCDRVVYSLSRGGVKFANCDMYFYDITKVFCMDSFNKRYPVWNLWELTRTVGDDLYRYNELVKVTYSTIGTDDN